jgi:hypothetical protein
MRKKTNTKVQILGEKNVKRRNPLVSENQWTEDTVNKARLPGYRHINKVEDILLKYTAILYKFQKKRGNEFPIDSLEYAGYMLMKTKLMILDDFPIDQIHRNIGVIQHILAMNEKLDLQKDIEDNNRVIGDLCLENKLV